MNEFAQDYDLGTVAYAGHSCSSIPTGTSLFSRTFIAWLPPAAICSIAMAKDKQGGKCLLYSWWLQCKLFTCL